MTQVYVDSETRRKLNGLSELTILRDEHGELLGYFRPARPLESYEEGVIPELSDEEFQRRIQRGGGRTWAEIKRDLERLG